MIRALLRNIGLPVHRGWRATHPSGYCRECVGCGEAQSMYARTTSARDSGWWETTKSGDGSCGPIPELPERL